MGDNPPTPGVGRPPDSGAREHEPPSTVTPISASIANLLSVHKNRMESQPGPSSMDASLENCNVAQATEMSANFGTETVVFVGDEVEGVLSSSPAPSGGGPEGVDSAVSMDMEETDQGHGEWQIVNSPKAGNKRKNLSMSGSPPHASPSNGTRKKLMMSHTPVTAVFTGNGFPIPGGSKESETGPHSDPEVGPATLGQSEIGKVVVLEPVGSDQEKKHFIGKSIQLATLLHNSLFGQTGIKDIKINFKKKHAAITMNSDQSMANLLAITKLGPYRVKCSQPVSHTTSYGVIHPVGLETTMDEIHEALSVWENQTNIIAERVCKKQGGEVLETRNIRLKFQCLDKPSHVYLAHQRFEVHPYVGKVLQCFNCQGFDHTAKFCRVRQPKCTVCSGPHKLADCPGERVRCSNCSGAHTSGYGGCPKMKIATKVSKIVAKGKLSRKEAIVIVNRQSAAQAKRALTHSSQPQTAPPASAWNSDHVQNQQHPDLERDFPPLRTAQQSWAAPVDTRDVPPTPAGVSVACQTEREVACQTEEVWPPAPQRSPQPDNGINEVQAGAQSGSRAHKPSENTPPVTDSFVPDSKFLGCLMEIIGVLMRGDTPRAATNQTGLTAIAKVIKKFYGISLPPSAAQAGTPASRPGAVHGSGKSGASGGNNRKSSTINNKNGAPKGC